MPDLQIEDLHVRFSGVVALNGVSMEIREGEIFSLVGPNGSGKTTLFNCVSGFVKPHHGTICYGSLDLLSRPPHRIIDAGISRTFQNLQNVPI
jgi:branched-chain amino acid transport system ATP-binding protein